MTVIDDSAIGLVRRARAGDQNATAMILRVGEEARRGNNRRATVAFTAIQDYIDRNPAQDFVLGAEGGAAIIMDPPNGGSVALVASTPPTAKEIEARKPPLPRGIFDKLFDPDWSALVIVKACQYRNGLPATAAVLASGPPLTNTAIKAFGASQFGSEESTSVFFHGVRFSGDDAWAELAPHLDPPLRRCLAIGQCVGRARKIQQVREKGSSISAFSPTVGWELGE